MTPEILDRYAKALSSFRNELKTFALKNEAGFYSFDNSTPLIAAIGELLK